MPVQAFRLQFSVDGTDTVDVALPRWRQSLSDLTDFFKRYAAPKLYADIEDNFAREGALQADGALGANGGGAWRPLSPAYAAWKQKHYPGRPILQRTRKLVSSMTFDGARPGPDGIFEVSRTAMVLGTRIKYGRYHQRPTVPGRPPQRRFLFLLRGASETLGRLLHRYAVDQAKASGLRTRGAIQAASGLVPIVAGPGGSTL